MHIKNIFINIVLIVAMILGLCRTTYAEYMPQMYSEEDIAVYEQRAALLNRLDILDESKDIQDIVTREEFAHIVVRFFGFGAMAESRNTVNMFSDTSGSIYSKDIETAASLNLMSAWERDLFRPTGKLTYDVMFRAIINGLGYGNFTQPGTSGVDYYESVARFSELKTLFTMAIRGDEDDNYGVIYGELVNFLEEALFVDIMKYSIQNGQQIWQVVDGENIMNTVHFCEENEGIVTATNRSELYGGAETASAEYIEIDGKLFEYDGAVHELLGYNVKYYVKQNAGDEKLIYLCPNLKKNTELTISSEDINQYKDRVYSYSDENNKMWNVKVPTGSAIIYNGRANVPDGAAIDMTPENGFVKLLDNNGDGNYEVVFVESRDTMVVGSIDAVKKIIYDKFEKDKTLSLENMEDGHLFVTSDTGKTLEFNKISEGNVLTIVMSADSVICSVTVSSIEVQGVLKQVNEEEAVIEETTYKLAPQTYGIDEAKVGKEYTGYFDEYNRLVYLEIEKDGAEAVYLIRAGIEEVEEYIFMKVCNSTGAVERLRCVKENLYLNDVKIRGSELNKVIGVLSDSEGVVRPQLIIIERNSDGEVKRIYTEYEGDPSKCPYNRFSLNSSLSGDSSRYIRARQRFSDQKTILSADTQVFLIPTDPINASDNDFRVISPSDLVNEKNYGTASNPVKSYVLGTDSATCNYVVIDAAASENATIAIIEKISVTIDVDEDDTVYMKLDDARGTVLYISSESDINLDSVAPLSTAASAKRYSCSIGDVVYYKYKTVNGKNIVTSINMLYDIESGDYLANNPSSTNMYNNCYYMADVFAVRAGYAGMVITGGNETFSGTQSIGPGFQTSAGNFRWENISSASLYRYSSGGKVCTVLKNHPISDIVPYTVSSGGYSKIFVYSTQGNAQYCYLVK